IYVSNDSLPSSTTTSTKVISEVKFDKHLDSIKEKYTMLISQVPQKRLNTGQNVNLCNSSNNKHSNNKSTSLNFVDIISQVQKGTFSAKTAYTEQISSSNNLVSTSQNRSQHISSHATCVEDKENAAFISDDDLTELIQVRIQEAMPETKNKCTKNLRSAKK
ncbi:8642_t:CDS:1, partial [Gigaspora margarita]